MPDDEFRPILLPRRSEWLAWGSALLMLVGWVILQVRNAPILAFIPFLVLFFFLAAMSISLGNWMDRKTLIRIDPGGIHFENGLRRVSLRWEQIVEVQAITSSWGKKIRVYGDAGHFDFRTLGEMKAYGEVQGRMGFEQGELIFERILINATLKETSHQGNQYYYARK